VIDAEHYLLACYRYIELNPVRVSMVVHPGDYPWSSYRAHAYGESNPIISDHDLYLRLGRNSMEQCHAYREFFRSGLDAHDMHAIRTATSFSTPLGNDRFKTQIEAVLGRSIGYARKGRPPSRQEKKL
jgi:putative transposase